MHCANVVILNVCALCVLFSIIMYCVFLLVVGATDLVKLTYKLTYKWCLVVNFRRNSPLFPKSLYVSLVFPNV